MIGLVDYDFYSSTSTTKLIPNIEIMKLATYYRNEKNIFCRLIGLDETELTSYDKIYFFSESEKPIIIPDAFKKTDNILFGGTAFTNNYIPFEDSIIDYTIPRPAIYKEILKQKFNDGIKSKIISHTLDDSYYRMYAGENKLPITPIRLRKRVFIFDKKFFQPDWKNIINNIVERKPSTIFTIHPIRCKTLTEYFSIRSIEKISRANEIVLELDIPLTEVYYMLKHYKNKFLADISETSNVFITLGGDFKYSKQYFDNFIYKMNLLFSFWSNNIIIKIKYDEPHLGFADPLTNLSKLVETWAYGSSKKEKSLTERTLISSTGKPSAARQEKDLLLEKYPNIKDLFNQTYTTLLNKGAWKYDFI